jgi:hypothetical protein
MLGSTPPPSGVSRLVQILFGRDESDVPPGSMEGEGENGAELVSVCKVYGAHYEEILGEKLFKLLHDKETRGKCLKFARIIRKIQLQEVNNLYKYIVDASLLLQNDMATFQILENLYCVLETLSIPLPPGFSELLCNLGFRVLNRKLFRQYLERHIFYVTDSFILNVLNNNLCPNDANLRFLLMLKLKNFDALVRVLWNDKDNSKHLISHFISLLGIVLPETVHDVDLLESSNQSRFIPLQVFREHVRVRSTVNETLDNKIIDFVYQLTCDAIVAQLT